MNQLWLLLFSLVTLPVNAQALNPSSYSMPNGELGPAGLLYRDDVYNGNGDRKLNLSPLSAGLGQLSDGMTGCSSDPSTDCGRGAGYDWVGWHQADPTITFAFGQRCDFKIVRIYTANQPGQDAPLWKSATVSLSDDGLTFRDIVIRTTTPEEKQDRNARYFDVPLNGSGKFVQVHLIRADANSWTLISEVLFEGRISRDQAPPAKPR